MEKFLRSKLPGGKFHDVSAARSGAMRAVKGKGNKTTEMRFCAALLQAGMTGFSTNANLIGNPDIVFPYYKIAVFLDGCFWHGCPRCGHIPKTNQAYWQTKIARNKQRDHLVQGELREQGHLVIRFWEHELIDNIYQCLATLQDAIEERLSPSLYNWI
jgi:DNA mismatch endonuclease (patch repair protein)